ncbi:hypothetical protein [Microvirga terricola]|uniref:Lipoprotein n=1 Tax=Microvirga terricola TaxID=2719797 RepID=A0ABX0VF62_9HYPH|nr:hypothetical protein [Microvirga terricola]NIX76981.1 hypothetical protein [Microvirga terricola]
MSRWIRNFALSCAFAAFMAACASPGLVEISTYIGVAPTQVNTSCHGGYEVFDKKDEHRLLIRPYALSLMANGVCRSQRGLPRLTSLPGVWYAEPAQEYLTMQGSESVPLASRRYGCRLTAGMGLTASHSEFWYQCAPSASQAAPPVGIIILPSQ